MEQTLWSHLPLLVRSNSKDSVEYILQAFWRTRKTGLNPANRDIIRDMLHIQNESDLVPKFQREWRQDVLKDQGALPRLKTMTWDMVNPDAEFADHVAVINLKLLNDSQSHSKQLEVKFDLANDTLETMLNSMYSIRDQLSNVILGKAWAATVQLLELCFRHLQRGQPEDHQRRRSKFLVKLQGH